MSSKALIAASECGKILGATPEAYAILGVPELSDLDSRSINDLWNISLEDLKPLSAHNVPLKMCDGATAYATAFLPELKKSTAAAKVQKPGLPSPAIKAGSLQKPLDRVAGKDLALREIVTLCRRVMNKDLPVLLLGETGVGKDTLARAMHDESERRLRPFVAVNCAAIPESLLASELFGYMAGSFTGASRNGRVGKIQASDSGTLFLDEIGDMPLDLQAHLLRVLEERTVTPLGSTDAIPVDIRIVCATHQELPKLVEKGKFRRDLYFRIKGVQVTIPSLRHRQDAVELAESIAMEEAEILGQQPPTFSEDALDLIRQYPWPGNIREMRSVIRLVHTIYGDQLITADHLPDELHAHDAGLEDDELLRSDSIFPSSIRAGEDRSQCAPTTLSQANEVAEERLIREALQVYRWNVTNAARQLGISRATLHRKIRKYGIVSPNNQV